MNLPPERSVQRRLQRPAPGTPSLSERLRFAGQRLDRRRIMALLAAIAAAWITAAVVSQARAEQMALGTQVPTVVANHDLAAGQVVGPDDVETVDVPIRFVPPGAADIGGVVGRTVLSPIAGGEIVAQARIATDGDLEPAERAITIPQPLAAPPLDRGDIVELVAITASGDQEGSSAGSSGLDAALLGSCRVLMAPTPRTGNGDPDSDVGTGITVACEQRLALTIVTHLAVGPIEILRTPSSR